MKYIFCGYMFPNIEENIKKMKVPPPVSSDKYMKNLVRGLIENGQDVVVLNTPRIRYYPHYPRIFVRKSCFRLDGKELGTNAGFVNLPLINYITRAWCLKRTLRSMIRKLGDETVTLVCFNLFLPDISAMIYARRRFRNVRLCGVIGDLIGENGAGTIGTGIKNYLIRRIKKREDTLVKQFDAFGFLTKYMPEALGVARKPFVVIEGMHAETKIVECTKDSKNTNGKMAFYAGAISREYGMLHLLKAFSMIEDKEYRLVIAGGGGAVGDVKKCAEKDGRIRYLGFITPAEVEQWQQRATVLINPRTSDHTFVKYSFPSKNMECLASGKPYIAHDLICNPPEYKDYIQYPADESDEALARKIVEVCELPLEQRLAIGKRAREFILREKNPQRQCKKIVDMMEQIERDRNKNDKESEI